MSLNQIYHALLEMSEASEARKDVEEAASRHGVLTDNDRQQMLNLEPNLRALVEDGLMAGNIAKRSMKKYASPSWTAFMLFIEADLSHRLAGDLHHSNANFLLELLRNADNNNYTRARAAKEKPYISFDVHPDKIVVDCNEDGFTKDDLRAICCIGKSWGLISQRPAITEKGFGFKSVFTVASRVHIQSGDYSFYFQHERGDDGMGMIRPIWQDMRNDWTRPRTRITLHLQERGEAAELDNLRAKVLQQFRNLRSTCLLFLQQMEYVAVNFYDGDGDLESSEDYKFTADKIENDSNRESPEGFTGGGADKNIITLKKLSTNLEGTTKEDTKSPGGTHHALDTAEIILAFPLMDDLTPIVEQQDLFALLPIKACGLKFLAHSNLFAHRSGRDSMTILQHDDTLVDQIAETFVQATLQFCEHPQLQHAWPSYLPQSNEGHAKFLSTLILMIKRRFETTPILFSTSHSELRLIADVHTIPTEMLDGQGNFLFDDSSANRLISQTYTSDDHRNLLSYGLKSLPTGLIVDLIETDVRNISDSKMRSKLTGHDWHSATASLISQLFENEDIEAVKRIKKLPLLPLMDGRLIAADARPVYFPATEGISVPGNIDIQLIEVRATENVERMRLFHHLGVKEPEISLVRDSILKRHQREAGLFIDLSTSKAHLHYLYLTHQHKKPEENFQAISVYDQQVFRRCPIREDVYLREHPYGAGELLRVEASSNGKKKAFDLPIVFLHDDYMNDIPTGSPKNNPPWTNWLRDSLYVRETIRLVTVDGTMLSPEFNYVVNQKRHRILGLLQHFWMIGELPKREDLIDQLKLIMVPTMPTGSLRLKDAYLPFSHLQAVWQQYGEDGEMSPFLALGQCESDWHLQRRWMFLHTDLGVRKSGGLQFLLLILLCIRRSNTGANSLKRPERLIALYRAIDEECRMAEDTVAAKRQVREILNDNELIYIPSPSSFGESWARIDTCIWHSLAIIYTKKVLKFCYRDMLKVSTEDMEFVSDFFQNTLLIGDAKWMDFVHELRYIKGRAKSTYKGQIWEIYSQLGTMRSVIDVDLIRKEFEDQSLVYMVTGYKPTWRAISQSLLLPWTGTRGQRISFHVSKGMMDFFREVLGVRMLLNIQEVYDELLQVDSDTSIHFVKNVIWILNNYLQCEPAKVSEEMTAKLLKSRIFPVRYTDGTVKLDTLDTEFAIIDRRDLGQSFEGKARVLDFSRDEVWGLKEFIKWAGLEPRYLSCSVEEVTSLGLSIPQHLSSIERNVKYKAHALFRIAVHFNTPLFETFGEHIYNLLLLLQTREVDKIELVQTLHQDDDAILGKNKQGQLYFEVNDYIPSIHVLMDEEAQEFVFNSVLPGNIADWLFSRPTLPAFPKTSETLKTARDQNLGLVAAITSVLNCRLSLVDQTLEQLGIIEVDTPNRDLKPEPANNERVNSPISKTEKKKMNITAEFPLPPIA
ncbi:Protein NO VEIN-like protein [Cladobotryum mycophilum]|uniref:Protein NO VEIN-like protein n=1 Tax=Cladobotryum mycophilum TaxID=491253 RepID=A0ABR0S898_9HYPO